MSDERSRRSVSRKFSTRKQQPGETESATPVTSSCPRGVIYFLTAHGKRVTEINPVTGFDRARRRCYECARNASWTGCDANTTRLVHDRSTPGVFVHHPTHIVRTVNCHAPRRRRSNATKPTSKPSWSYQRNCRQRVLLYVKLIFGYPDIPDARYIIDRNVDFKKIKSIPRLYATNI